MNFSEKIRLHWRRYRRAERAFVLLPFLLLTPRLIPDLEVGHNGEPSQELAVTTALCCLLLLLAGDARRHAALRFHWQGQARYLLLAMSCFVAWSAASLVWTTDVGATQDHTLLWLNYVALIGVGRLVLRRRSVLGLLATLSVAGVGVAALCLTQYWLAAESRAVTSAIYKNYGVEVEVLMVVLPLVWVIYLTTRRRMLVWLALTAAVCILMGGLSTYQRAPLLACFAATGCLLLGLCAKWLRPRNYGRVVTLAATLLVAGGLQYAMPTKALNPMHRHTGGEFVLKQIKGIRTLEVDTSSRLQFWGTALEMARAHPLTGIGAGAYKTGYVQYRRRANAHPLWGRVQDFSQTEGAASVYRAHNEWLEILGELGGVGGGLIVCLLLIIARLLWQVPSQQRWLSVAVGACTAAFFISSSFTSYSLRWMPCGLLFFLIVALLLPLPFTPVNAPHPLINRAGQGLVVAYALLLLFGIIRAGQVLGSEYYQYRAAQQATLRAPHAIALYQQALALDPYNFSAAAELGALYYRQRQPQAATNYLAYGVQHGVNDIFKHAMLSFAYARLGQQARACDVLQQAVEAYPGTIFTRVLYAEALAKDGRLAAAQEQRAITQNINAEDALLWDLIVQQGGKPAALTAARQQLSHFSKLEPKNGLGLLQERERVGLE